MKKLLYILLGLSVQPVKKVGGAGKPKPKPTNNVTIYSENAVTDAFKNSSNKKNVGPFEIGTFGKKNVLKGLLKNLAKETEERVIVRDLLKSTKLAKEDAEMIAPQIAKTTSEKEVKNILDQVSRDVASKNIKTLATKEFEPYKSEKVSIFPVQEKTIKAGEKQGFNLAGYNHEVDNYALRHTLQEHGSDPLPITINDFERIPQILESPDGISYTGKTKQGLDTFRYVKKFENDIDYIEEIRTGQKTLNLKTMYKRKSLFGASDAQSGLRAVRPPQQAGIATPKNDILTAKIPKARTKNQENSLQKRNRSKSKGYISNETNRIHYP